MSKVEYIYCITKYNSLYRNVGGGYERDEWIGVGDIGKKFRGKEFTQNEYLKVEMNYLKAVELIAKNEEFFTITKLEKHSNVIFHKKLPFSENEIDFFNNLYNRKRLNLKETVILSKLILRNELWAILKSKNVKIEFGYDYYMYFIVKKILTEEIIRKIESLNLFVEKVAPSREGNEKDIG